MKTKSDFMRVAKEGNIKLKLIGGKNYEWIKEKRPQNLNPRAVVKTQTNAIYLEGEENHGQGSYLPIPAASLMEYDGETLKKAVADALAEEGTGNKSNIEKFSCRNPEGAFKYCAKKILELYNY